MRKILILSLLCCVVFAFEAKPQQDFWSRVNIGILGGPLFPSGDEVDASNLSTGYYIGIEAHYQLARFMAIGISVVRNS